MRDSKNGALPGSLRVLDISDEKGYLCGEILGVLGADVVKIERPGGDPGRKIGPFYHDIAHPEKSLYWFAYNACKRGITLNIEVPDGQEILKALIKKADFLIESFPPGYMASLGLAYDDLVNIKRDLIVVSITPFGQTGPYKDYKGSDLVCAATSGFMSACGDPDRAPLRISFPQAYFHAGAEAAVGAMIAYYYRETTGEGQHVDISAQQALFWAIGRAPSFWELHKEVMGRVGQFRTGLSISAKQRHLWQCKDGYVSFQIFGGKFGAKSNRATVDWMKSEGMADEFLLGINWDEFDMSEIDQALMDRIEEPIGKFLLTKTMDELDEAAIDRDMVIFAVNPLERIVNHPQLRARNFWVDLRHPELDTTITYPAVFTTLTETPLQMYRRAPLIGEHNEGIYLKELKFPRAKLVQLKQAGII